MIHLKVKTKRYFLKSLHLTKVKDQEGVEKDKNTAHGKRMDNTKK